MVPYGPAYAIRRMANKPENDGHARLMAAAALEHFVHLKSGDATVDDQQRFEVWKQADPAHAREYEKLVRLWTDLDDLPALEPVPMVAKPYSRRAYLPHAAHRHGTAWRGAALGITLLFLTAGVWLTDALTLLRSDYHTGAGEQRTLSLADGSRINMNTDSALAVDFSASARQLTLLKGEVLVTVAADPGRPFIVVTNNGNTRAVGTQFDVTISGDEVTVTTVEHRVEVTLDNSGKPSVRVAQGQSVTYDAKSLSAPVAADLNALTAWRRGKLVFDDRPLGQVIEQINRYREGKILIVDPRLRDFRVSGIFDIARPDSVLSAIEHILPVRSVRLTRYLVLLSRAEGAAGNSR